jgi:DNA modification methylase
VAGAGPVLRLRAGAGAGAVTAAVIRGDARCLPLPDACADLIVTSPPYFGLRSYTDDGEHYDGQIGSEASPREWLAALVACTREWVRVLKPSGSLFVNLGDKYSGAQGPRNGVMPPSLHDPKVGHKGDKSLLGLPWRYALACTDELGLILRRDIIWSKPNGLPESVTDRCRSSHEYLFHLVRQPRYYAAVDEIREPHESPVTPGRRHNGAAFAAVGRIGSADGTRHTDGHPLGKLPGSVWDIPSQPLTVPAHLGVDHFAAFPMELPRRCILGWSPPGICLECGEGRRPVSVADVPDTRAWALAQRGGRSWHGDGTDPKRALGVPAGERNRIITGYACACPQPDAPVRPALVLDPFGGTGTTALVAAAYGRTGVSVDLSGDYCRLARWRVTDPAERAKALLVAKPPPVPDGQASLFDLEDAG